MENQFFTIYEQDNTTLRGDITDGCLHLESNVFGDYDSEQHYSFSKEDTEKLFGMISLEDLIQLCVDEHLYGLDIFLKKNGIKPMVTTF